MGVGYREQSMPDLLDVPEDYDSEDRRPAARLLAQPTVSVPACAAVRKFDVARTRTTTAGYRGAHRAHARPYPELYILVDLRRY